MTAYQSIPSSALAMVFPWVILLVVGSAGFFFGFRNRWLRRGRVRLCAMAGFALVSLTGAGCFALGVSPSINGEPAVIFTADSIDCSPWGEALSWTEVDAMEARSEKMGSGWRRVGIWLRVRQQDSETALALRAVNHGALGRLSGWLWRADPAARITGAPWNGLVRYCHLAGLSASPQALINAMEEAWQNAKLTKKSS